MTKPKWTAAKIGLLAPVSCATVEPSVARDPRKGRIAQCMSTASGGAFPFMNAWTARHGIDTCAGAYTPRGWAVSDTACRRSLRSGFRFFFLQPGARQLAACPCRARWQGYRHWLDPVELNNPDGFRAHELNRLRGLVIEYRDDFGGSGMSITARSTLPASIRPDSHRSRGVRRGTADRAVGLPGVVGAAGAWRLATARCDREERRNWEPVGRGHGIHWPDLDEDISVRVPMGRAPRKLAFKLIYPTFTSSASSSFR